MQLDGMITIIAGGASGLGAATARLFSSRGAKVTLFDLDEKGGQVIADEIGGYFHKVDVTDDSSIAMGLDAVEQQYGVPRILVNCAGIAPGAKTVGRDFTPHSMDLFRKVIAINLVGSYSLLSQFSARLAQHEPIGEERGVIINTASVAAFDGQVGQAAYSASKAAIAGMALPVARDLASLKIRVMTIAPGIFWTPMLAGMPENVQNSLSAQIPHPSRFGKPEEYAALAEAIVMNPMLNGETIRLDGAVRMAAR